jgi:hypothetical protein
MMGVWWTIPIIVVIAFLIGFAWGRLTADIDTAKQKTMREQTGVHPS